MNVDVKDCNGRTWHEKKRTHTLSNGQVIWDLGGNVSEWVRDDNSTHYGLDSKISRITTTSHTLTGRLESGVMRNAKGQFGPSGNYLNLDSSRFSGLGQALLDLTKNNRPYYRGAVMRGGYFAQGGIFSTRLRLHPSSEFHLLGFRCTYYP